MATYNNKPASVGLSDPKLVRQTETALAQASLIARGKPTVTSAGELILPNTTLSVGANSVSTTTSANNSSTDVVTIYSGQGAIYASSIDQTVNQTIVNNVGVSSIVAGNNITITSTGVSAGTGIVTVNAVLDGNSAPGGSNTQIQFNDAGVFGGNTGFTFNKTTGVLAAPFFSGPGNSLSNIQGTNVTGAVAFAGTANSVALANVSGAGNIASINLTGSTSNVLYGNGAFGVVSVTAFTSNINGNGFSLGNVGNIAVTGAISATGNATVGNIIATNIGNISSINQDGNASNVLHGNGTFRAFTAFSANINGNGFNLGNIGNIEINNALSVTGNANIGNIGTGGLITATGNITGANLVTGGVLTVTGNATVGNIIATNIGNIASINLTGSTTNVLYGNGAFGVVSVTAFTANVNGNGFSLGNVGNIAVTGAISATGNANIGNIGTGGLITATGNVIGGNLVTAGNVQTENIVNITANTSIGMGNGSGILVLTSAGNSTQFNPSGVISLGGASQIVGGTFAGSGITLGGSQTDIFQNRGGNVTVQVGTGGTIANTWTFAQDGSFTSPGNISTTANANVGNLNVTGTVKTGVFVTGNIPAAATAGVSARAFVTDATVATFGSAYVGGAANAVPVWSDGTGWFIG